jgi:hypothetical protein
LKLSFGRNAVQLQRAIAAIFVSTLLGGCASPPHAYFFADRTRGEHLDQTPVETRSFVPVGASELRIASEARMFDDEPITGLRVPTLHVRVYVLNYGRAKFEMVPDTFVASDETGARFPLSQCWQNGQRTGIVLADAPTRAKVDLFFRLPEGYDVQRPRSFRLAWGFRVNDEEVRHDTSYERATYRPFRDPFFEAPS